VKQELEHRLVVLSNYEDDEKTRLARDMPNLTNFGKAEFKADDEKRTAKCDALREKILKGLEKCKE